MFVVDARRLGTEGGEGLGGGGGGGGGGGEGEGGGAWATIGPRLEPGTALPRLAGGQALPPPPPSRTNWTRLVHPSVLTGHVSSLLPY